ncbi:MAG: hypothetical protein A2Y38_01700, partial [Spirochaetes bacterium GWB1_59_5]
MTDSYLVPTRVECYSGSRADEMPRAVWVDGVRHEVREVVDRWYHGSSDPTAQAAEYFRLRTDGEKLLLIR